MSYNYNNEKSKIFTEEGQREFLKVRDRTQKLLAEAGAFTMSSAIEDLYGDSWLMMAYIDRLIELGEIREITPANVAGQHRVFVSAVWESLLTPPLTDEDWCGCETMSPTTEAGKCSRCGKNANR